jgi:3-phenylpropionate/trans-cinnamate dioxygenase ferredoxin subunit
MTSELIDVCTLSELPPGTARIVEWEDLEIGVFNCNGELLAIEDRCSHDDGPLCEGDFDAEDGVAVCPRHGARIEISTGRPLSLPAVEPVETFPVRVVDGMVRVEVA